MGGDSYLNDREFESQHRILDGHFSHLFVVKIAVTKDEKNEKEAVFGPFLTFSKYCWYDRNNNKIFPDFVHKHYFLINVKQISTL